jgi:enoyl-CoA hydratase/carnithine racemase
VSYQEIDVGSLAGDERVRVLTLDRPLRRNAYTQQLCTELVDALHEADTDDTVRTVVLTGRGTAFCAGGDVRSADEAERGDAHPFGHGRVMQATGHAVVRALVSLSKPTVAKINGAAVAGGLAFALACDLRVAAASARLGDTSGRLGLLPDEGGAWLFPRAMGREAALRMSLLGEVYDAARARELGLVGEVVPDDDLDEVVADLARRLAAAAPLASSVVTRLVRRSDTMTLEQSLDALTLAVDVVNRSEDVAEGVTAFLERRPPVFRGC